MQAKHIMTKVSIAVAFALSAGCATTNTQSSADMDTAVVDTTTQDISAELDSRASALDSRETELRQLEASIADSKAAAMAANTASSNSSNHGAGDLLPPDAQAGECYARVWVPAQYKTVSEQMLASEESERIEVIPATYEWDSETIEVSAASSKVITSPAVYGTESEQILVSDSQIFWKTTLNRNSAYVSDSQVAFAKDHGADTDAATPGMCYHEHLIPATYTTNSERVLASEESETVTAVPATYRMVEQTIVVSEASSKIIQVPATYKTVSEKVLVKPAHTTWKKGTGPIQRIDQSTGEIMCLIEVPAEYKTVSKRVIDTAATTRTIDIPEKTKTIKVREEATSATERRTAIPATYKTVSTREKSADSYIVWHEIHNMDESSSTRTGQQICMLEKPAVYKTVTKRVVKTPASSHEVAIPAQYKTVKVQKLVSSASDKRIVIPATYKQVAHQELVSDGFMQWRSILCKTNTTPGRISKIQQALKGEGFNPGPIDGVIGSETIKAINAFQRKEGLPVDKYLNVKTIKALGVSVK